MGVQESLNSNQWTPRVSGTQNKKEPCNSEAISTCGKTVFGENTLGQDGAVPVIHPFPLLI